MTPILRRIADQLSARVAVRDPLSVEELRQLEAAIRLAAETRACWRFGKWKGVTDAP